MTKLLNALKAHHPSSTPMHMPGHMRNTSLAAYLSDVGAQMDITEITGFDDLHKPEGILLESMKEASSLWGSKETRYLIGGSTCGIIAAVYALASGGGRAVCARNAHKSLYHALEITGVEPVFVSPAFDDETGMALEIRPEDVLRALDENDGIRFVFLVSPTYEGVISDVKAICDIAHERGVPVIVDEAHGAHLDLCGVFPFGAVKAGADLVIQSLHKTLPSLTQTAVLHASGELVSMRDIDHALDIFETSSPSYLLMASIDGCVSLLREKGDMILSGWKNRVMDFRKKAKALKHIRVFKPEGAYAFDESKLILYSAYLSGVDLKEMLASRFSIELEAAYQRYAVAMTGAGTTDEMLKKLFDALYVLDGELSEAFPLLPSVPTYVPERKMLLKNALLKKYECVLYENASGRISGEYVWAYPPGVPVVAPGEVIDEKVLSIIRGMEISHLNIIKTRSEKGEIAVLHEDVFG